MRFGAPSGADPIRPAPPLTDILPQPARLYGRQSGHKLRPRQRLLLDATLPRLRFPVEAAATPARGFGRPVAALRVEIGFGGGEHAEAIARAYPGDGLIAAEVFANGICSLLSRLVPEGGEATAPVPDNLRLWDEDARILLASLPDGALDGAFLMFPDPWPKARHAKRRFVHPANVALLGRLLKPGAEWRLTGL